MTQLFQHTKIYNIPCELHTNIHKMAFSMKAAIQQKISLRTFQRKKKQKHFFLSQLNFKIKVEPQLGFYSKNW